jgi:hypothetical protein
LLLATASVARDLTAALPDDLDYKVWMTRRNHNDEDCSEVDVVIQAQMHESATSSTEGLFNRPVYREHAVPPERKLRAGASPRELGYCDEDCRCYTIIMCQLGGYCADTCHPCECRIRRRMEDLPEFLSEGQDVESSLAVVEVAGEGAGKVSTGKERSILELISAGTDNGDGCPKYNNETEYTQAEIEKIMTCSTRKAIITMARTFLDRDGNNCLGDPDLLEVHVEIFSVPMNHPIAVDPVDLGNAEDYVILTKSGISNVPDSVITGDIAVSPIAATAMTGFSLAMDSSGQHWKSSQLAGGKAFAADNAPTSKLLTKAVIDMEAAYTDAMSRPFNEKRINLEGGVIGGGFLGSSEATPLTTGVYTFTTDVVNIASDIYFSGTADDVFIIQLTGILKQAAGTTVHLSNGALAENIFWQVAGHVVVGTGAHMEGILLAKTHVVFETGSSLTGRVLAQTACVLQKATITDPPSRYS